MLLDFRMDAARKRIKREIEARGLTYKDVSLALDRNAAYIQQFIERNVPAKLKEAERLRLSELLDIPESELGAPARQGKPPEAGTLAALGVADQEAMARNQIPDIDLRGGLGGGGIAMVEQAAGANGITFAREVVRDFWRLPDWIAGRINARPQQVASFPVKGDSMAPTLDDGDAIFVDTSHRVPSPPGIYALADEFGEVIVKRLEVISKPSDDVVTVRVISDNQRHGPRELPLSEISIIGRYVGRFTV